MIDCYDPLTRQWREDEEADQERRRQERRERFADECPRGKEYYDEEQELEP